MSIIFLIAYYFYKKYYRLNKEFNLKKMNIIILKISFFWVNDNDFKKIEIDGHELYLTGGSCWSIPSTCIRDQNSISIQNKKNYIFYLRK